MAGPAQAAQSTDTVITGAAVAGGGPHFGKREAAALFVAVATLLLAGPGSADDPQVQSLAVIVQGYGGAALTSPGGAAFDAKRGELLVANTGQHRIEVLSLEGRPVARLLHPVRQADGTQLEGMPHALAVCPDGLLLVADYLAPYVDVLDFRGRSVARLDLAHGADSADADRPSCVALEPGGSILVGTGGKTGRIYRFGPDYRPAGSWGEPGSAPGQLSAVTCIAATPDGRIAVGCVQTDLAIQLFDREGRYLTGFGRHELGPGNFSLPSGIAVTSDGRIWVSDEIRQKIQVFDSTGNYVGKVSGGDQEEGEFLYPNSVACLGDTLLAVTEKVGNRLQLLKVR